MEENQQTNPESPDSTNVNYSDSDPSHPSPEVDMLFSPEHLARILGGAAAGFTAESFPPEYYKPFNPNPTDRIVGLDGPGYPYPDIDEASHGLEFPYHKEASSSTGPLRQGPHDADLGCLDDQWDSETHYPPLDTDHMVGRGRDLATSNFEEPSVTRASKILADFVQDRLPYVELAGKRLHALTDQSENHRFALPHDVQPQLPPFPSMDVSERKRNAEGKGKGVEINEQHLEAGPPAMFDQRFAEGGLTVDHATGEGLRQWLLGMVEWSKINLGKFGRRQLLTSCSFHDIAPSEKGDFQNELLAHYDSREGGSMIEFIECWLPLNVTDKSTGAVWLSSEPWVWILIQRPVLMMSRDDTSTNPNPILPGATNTQVPLRPPPTFPEPHPINWVVIAAPTANITASPTQEENFDPAFQIPVQPPLGGMSSPASDAGTYGKRIFKRRDYDFAFGGIPLFEFSKMFKKEFFPRSGNYYVMPYKTEPHLRNYPIPEFLSVEKIGPWYEDGDDDCDERDNHDLEEVVTMHYGRQNHKAFLAAKKDKFLVFRDPEEEHPSRYHGKWWDTFQDGVYRDAARWRWIKAAMSEGTCRIVLRWTEWEEGEKDVRGDDALGLDADMEDGFGSAKKKVKSTKGVGVKGKARVPSKLHITSTPMDDDF